MKAPFTKIFIIVIDTILNDSYDNPIPRKDYLTFFEQFEQRISRNTTDFDTVQINDNVERTKWGRVKFNGKMVWKLTYMLKLLKEKNIIQCTGYLVGDHAKQYSYTEAMMNALDYGMFNVVEEEINEKLYTLLKNTKEYDESNPQYQLLKSNRFTIDVEKCTSTLIDLYDKDKMTKSNLLINIRRVYAIQNKDIFTVSIPSGRVYTSFNSLKRECREFCYIDNKPLKSIDLRASQPFILATYLLNKYPSTQDVQKFYDTVTTSDVYYWIMSKTNITDRNICKLETFMYLLKNTNRSHGIVQSLIQRELPELYNIISAERREISISFMLQSVEASVFIPVCERYTELGCLSVHDSLHYVEEIEERILIDLKRALNDNGLVNYKIK